MMMRLKFNTVVLCIILDAAALSLMAGGAVAQSVAPAHADHVTIYMQQSSAEISAAAAALEQNVKEQGQVRVIVGLRMTLQADETLSPAQMQQQRQALRAAQDGVAMRVLGRVSGDDIVRFDFIPYLSIYVDAAQVGRLLADPQVAVVQEDVPNDPSDVDSIPLIHADDLWGKADKGSGRTVAILDTGVAKNHPVLKGKVVSEACYSSKNGASGLSFCPGGAAHSTAAGSGVNCPTSIAACNHGTHVASIAAAMETSAKIGDAPSAKIIAIQVFTKVTTKAGCGTTAPPCAKTFDTDWLQALQRVYALHNTYHIDAVNMSLGGIKSSKTGYSGPCDATFPAAASAIKKVNAAGIAVVVASGNDSLTGSIAYPACISTAIAVGASLKQAHTEAEPAFSNESPQVKLLAPGVDINAAIPPNKFEKMSGTSMAAPAVAGTYALLRQAKPKASVNDILAALICTGKIIPVEGKGRPRIDLINAYNRLLLPPKVKRSWEFNESADEFDWTPFVGNWIVHGGTYEETVIKAQSLVASSTDNCNHSLQVVADMERIDPNESKNQRFSNAGIVIKSQIDYSDNKAVSGYFIGYNNCPTGSSGICGTGATPGQTFIFRLDGYSFVNNTGGLVLLCESHAPSSPTGFNTIKVVSQNNTHTYYLNGKLACKATDATYTVGPVMTIAAFSEAGGSPFKVDSMVITSLDSASSSPPGEAVVSEDGRVPDPSSFAPRPLPPGMSILGSRPLRTPSSVAVR
jgi:subtilisin family serine protease